MKPILFIGLLALAGCTTNTPPQAASQKTVHDVGYDSYSQDRLKNTGRETAGGALSEVDPSISNSRGVRQ